MPDVKTGEVKTEMKVEATQPGFFGVLRKPEDESKKTFYLTDEKQFSMSWMKPIGWTPECMKEEDDFLGEEESGSEENSGEGFEGDSNENPSS